jgi:hypothetical protein
MSVENNKCLFDVLTSFTAQANQIVNIAQLEGAGQAAVSIFIIAVGIDTLANDFSLLI